MALRMRKIGKDTEEDRMLNELFVSPIRAGFLEVGDDKYVIPIYYEKLREKVDNFQVRDDDVWITGHPKTGTTWLYHIVHYIANSSDKNAPKIDLDVRTNFFDYSIIFDSDKINADFGLDLHPLEIQNQRKSPRLIKSHLHWSLLPEQIKNGTKMPKIIHIVRNPKDTCVSYFYMQQSLAGYRGDFNQYCQLFFAGRLLYGPFFATPLSYWRERTRPNLLFVYYKHLKNDLAGSIRTISEFLEKCFTDAQVNDLIEHIRFEKLKIDAEKNLKLQVQDLDNKYNLTTKENNFFRVGREGGYRSEMSPEWIQKFDAWTKENLSGTELILE